MGSRAGRGEEWSRSKGEERENRRTGEQWRSGREQMCRGELGEEQLTNTLGNVTYYGKEMGGNERLSSGKKMPGSNERDESGCFQ
jgi:hypothetical protein